MEDTLLFVYICCTLVVNVCGVSCDDVRSINPVIDRDIQKQGLWRETCNSYIHLPLHSSMATSQDVNARE